MAVLKRPGGSSQKAVLLPAPLLLIPLLLTALGVRVAQWIRPFEMVARAAEGATVALMRPYPLVSSAHAVDIANAFLLVAPVPILLGLAWIAERRGRILPRIPTSGLPAMNR